MKKRNAAVPIIVMRDPEDPLIEETRLKRGEVLMAHAEEARRRRDEAPAVLVKIPEETLVEEAHQKRDEVLVDQTKIQAGGDVHLSVKAKMKITDVLENGGRGFKV